MKLNEMGHLLCHTSSFNYPYEDCVSSDLSSFAKDFGTHDKLDKSTNIQSSQPPSRATPLVTNILINIVV